MKQLLHILDQVPEFQQLLDALDAGRSPAAVSGLSPVHRAHFAAGIRRHWDCPVVMVCADDEVAGPPSGRRPDRLYRGGSHAAGRPGISLPRLRRGLPPVGAPPPRRLL